MSPSLLTALLIFGAGGPLTVEVEESCARLGVRVAGVVRNRDGAAYTLDPERVVEVAALPAVLRDVPFICPLFTPANRRIAVAEAERIGLAAAPAVVDPTAVVARSTEIGAGSYVNAGCIVGAAGRLGRFVLVNRAAGLGHHIVVGDFASIGPGVTIAGQVEIGEGAMIGAGAVVGPAVRLGAHCVLAPGAAVRNDVPAGAIAGGNPARVHSRRPPP